MRNKTRRIVYNCRYCDEKFVIQTDEPETSDLTRTKIMEAKKIFDHNDHVEACEARVLREYAEKRQKKGR